MTSTSQSGAEARAVSARRVLIVEDDAVIGELMAEMLECLGHSVCAIEINEADAVTSAARCMPDLMIVDAWLGASSGLDAVTQIERVGPVPHVFVTGNAAGVRALLPNAEIIQKPFREPELSGAIQRVLGAVHDA